MEQLVYQMTLFLDHKLPILVMMDLFFYLVMTHAPVKLMDSGQELYLHVVSIVYNRVKSIYLCCMS